MREKPLTEKEKKNIIREYIFKNTEDIEQGINGIYEFIESYTYRIKKTKKKLKEKIKTLNKENGRIIRKLNKRDEIIKKLEEETIEWNKQNDNKKILELEIENKKLRRENAELVLKLKNNGKSKDIKDIIDGIINI